ncbi:hypothetical protein [Plesiomonas shigelloides]|uniref:Hemolytic protein HlpA-like protein n=2 Tax=Plesiomonas shigelloides TaxID=703 RepID=R8ASE2_PLESH|nr:hypothetical protein [Plesiomonas shigelloides]EON89257.1 hemolytic protein HlpA-like protein [Plesiomonas shigelloides 302-73]
MTNNKADIVVKSIKEHNLEFEIPVVLFVFKREYALLKIIDVLRQVKPRKIYLLSDNGRNEDEKKIVKQVRESVVNAIDWDCEVIKKFQNENVGVYENIAVGAMWVFEKEDKAIFLEDDNLPEISFFEYCRELLKKYECDSRVLWICGSNYLEYSPTVDDASYIFTKNMLPCGWASWGWKFKAFYDGEFSLWNDGYIKNRLRFEYLNDGLYEQDCYNIEYEIEYKRKSGKYYSWDYQMAFSMRVNNLYAIVPVCNQIKNIGVDEFSIHGGNSMNNIMVERFCGRKTKEIAFPLKHPKSLLVDLKIEDKLERLILDPNFNSLRSRGSRWLRRMFKIDKTVSISSWIRIIVRL